MKKLVFVCVILVFILLEVSALNYVSIFNVKPDLLLISVIIASLFFEPLWAIALSIFAGFLKDIFSVNEFGIYTLLFCLWSFLIIKLSRQISFDNDYVKLAVLIIAVIVNNIIIGLIFSISGNFIPLGLFLRVIFLETLYTAFVFPFILKFTKKFVY